MIELELAGAFVAGIVFTVVMVAVSAKPLMRWSMRRMASGMLKAQIQKSTGAQNVKVDLNP